ncbi:hypothetical protein [Brevibacillus brevis]|uniref:Lipid/polyisoprenoid-binding YceI-like domain-containing protein n=1 Tax=Brevibacillus brevis TaxID=1393 RepID=A0ABY9T700_BREBE|nr:hypothetical protein [Brevibacillus brevis]WNC15678.1 hypothetical protein RGB73_04880 [Brevibacillus brevis]
MAIGQMTRVSLPYPTTWDIQASFGGRPTTLGTLSIQGVTHNQLIGSVNFRGTPLAIRGTWNEAARQIAFDSPFASFAGTMFFRDDPQIQLRHYVLQGQVRMKPPSIRAGETGTWTATTHVRMR